MTRLAGLLFALTVSSSIGCGSKDRKCDPFQSPGMTRADVDKQAAASGAAPVEEKCAGLDVVRVTSGGRFQAWYLKDGLVVGYTRGDDAGGQGCSGEVPPTCR